MSKVIKIGTRGSKLALFQAYYVEKLLNICGLLTEIVIIDTKGDQILDVSIAKIGSKGVFTEELEDKLSSGEIDIAVHSAKDMQSVLPEGFELIAFTEREVVNDIILSHRKDINIADANKPLTLGTSSTRRVAMLKHYYPHVKTVDVRGNLQTRVAKMEAGLCDGLLLAYAGAHRMGFDEMIADRLDIEKFTPAVGQGSIAVECATSLDPMIKGTIRNAVNHPETAYRLLAERAYLRELEGGCSIPVFGLATVSGASLSLEGGIVSLDGQQIIRKQVSGPRHQAEQLGVQLAEAVLTAGGDHILKEIKSQLNK